MRWVWLLLIPCQLWAAAPVVDATDNAQNDGTTHAANYAGMEDAGDIIISIACSDGGAVTVSWPGEFTEFMTDPAAAGITVEAAWTEATGSEAGTYNITTGVSEHVRWVTFTISGNEDPDTSPPEVTTSTDVDGGTNYDPPSHTPSGGSDDYLYIANACRDDGRGTDNTVSPTGYTAANHGLGNTVGGEMKQAWAYLGVVTSTTEDPSQFSGWGRSGENYAGGTISVVQPGAGGGGVAPMRRRRN